MKKELKNILIITQKIDEHADMVGSFVSWIREFALHSSEVSIIALEKGQYTLPNNVKVHSLGKEKGISRLSRYWDFVRIAPRLVKESDVIFCSYSSIYVIAVWPFALWYGKKIIFWYLHRAVTIKFRLAVVMCHKLVTATAKSINIKTHKLVEVGHGINVQRFATVRDWSDWGKRQVRLLAVGRISPIKGHHTLIEAIHRLKEKNMNLKLTIVGRPVNQGDEIYLGRLKEMVKNYDLEDMIKFVGLVPYTQIVPYYQRADIVINPLPKGGVDRTVFEAMASGALVLTSNEAFSGYLNGYEQLMFKYDSHDDLATYIEALMTTTQDQVQIISNDLQVRASKHSSKNVVENIMKLF